MKKVVPVFRGVWDWLAHILLSPGAALTAACCLAICAVLGLEGLLGTHPGEGLWVRLPLAVLPLFMLARALKESASVRLGALSLALGFWCVLAGSWPGGGQSGYVLVPPRAVQTIEVKNSGATQGLDFAIAQRAIWTESFLQETAGREVSVHAKMQFRAEIGPESVSLIYGQPKDTPAQRSSVEFSLNDGVEKTVGPWRMYLDGLEDGPYFDMAQLSLSPRSGAGEDITITLGLGTTETLSDGTTIRLDRVSYRDPLFQGPSIVVTRQWTEAFMDFPEKGIFPETGVRDNEEASTFYAAAPDLDERVGRSPWVIRFQSLERTPFARFGIRRASPLWILNLGLGLLILGSICVAFGRRASA